MAVIGQLQADPRSLKISVYCIYHSTQSCIRTSNYTSIHTFNPTQSAKNSLPIRLLTQSPKFTLNINTNITSTITEIWLRKVSEYGLSQDNFTSMSEPKKLNMLSASKNNGGTGMGTDTLILKGRNWKEEKDHRF